MKILVTGGCGFIGSNLIRYLLNQTKHSVVNVDKLTYAGNPSSVRDLSLHPNYTFKRIDICDSGELKEVFSLSQPDAVMHLAAESHVDRSIDGPAEFIQTNILGTYQLLQNSLIYWRGLAPNKRTNFRFLHVSTDEVYGSLGLTGAFTETTPYSPHSPYSASKASSDHLVRAWHDTYGLPTLVTNCSNNYGPYQFPEKLIPVMILKCLRGDTLPIYGRGENVRDWLYVEDHCRALTLALEHGKIGETYNIGGSNEMRNIDLVYLLCDLMDELKPRPVETGHSSPKSYREQITFVQDRPGHDLRYAIDASKIQAELGWQPLHDLKSGLRKTVQWYLENQLWWRNILSGDYLLERKGLPSAEPGE